MTLNSELATLGEPPASPDEEAWARWLESLLEEFERGQLAPSDASRQGTPELDELGRSLVVGATWLFQCATTLWEHSGPPPDTSSFRPGGETVPSDDTPPRNPAAAAFPDPFPNEYRVIDVLGEGAFGKVWLAEQLNVGRRLVAVKTLKIPVHSTNGPQVLAALKKDALALAKVEHPNIVLVYDLRSAGGEPFLVLRYVEGGSLAGRLKKDGPIDWQLASRYVADVGEALMEAHACGVIHRDIKPANILWDAKRDEALLTDFGVSSHLAEPGDAGGTPAYMAPEAWDGRVSPALDVFSLAVTFFQLVTGQLPFPAREKFARIYQISQGLPVPDPRCQGLPEPLEQIVRAGLACEPEKRPRLRQFVDDLRGALDRLLADTMIPPPTEPATAHTDLRLMVSREVAPGDYRPLPKSQPRRVGLTRDMKKVPRQPEQVQLSTGDRVRIEVIADRDGYVTVFNVGPSGNLNLLYPDEPPAPPPPPVRAGQPLHVLDVEITPPAGRERLFAVWSRRPMRLDQLETLAHESKAKVSPQYRATRDMKRVRDAVHQLPPEEGHAVVLELDHIESSSS